MASFCWVLISFVFSTVFFNNITGLINSTAHFSLHQSFNSTGSSELTDLITSKDLLTGVSSSFLSSNFEDVDNQENAQFEEFFNVSLLNNSKTEQENLTIIYNNSENRMTFNAISGPNIDIGGPAIGTAESAAILAGVFVIFAIGGYGAMLTWRRYLQVRYGNSDVLITDDVYDISDLRNFEI